MKTFLILLIMATPCLSLADSTKCSDKKVRLTGLYGEKKPISSPFLDTWSEVSGNLVGFEIISNESFTKAVLILKDEKSQIVSRQDIQILKNKSRKFDLISEIKKENSAVGSLDLQLFAGNDSHEFCHEETTIVEVDVPGAREVKDAKVTK